ncbi:hypothetical protein IJ22_25910 [Paenibacillus naphthalenovorans]|uniref:Uncharacterized protein n=1 Tax=Paenibacillus naphthalenovorans TaxID=162209 RepID=A0A0U2W331_9BACL|nr:hypothetical protein IJ22_25910 [Paenibacillus naphthalenovorans]
MQAISWPLNERRPSLKDNGDQSPVERHPLSGFVALCRESDDWPACRQDGFISFIEMD